MTPARSSLTLRSTSCDSYPGTASIRISEAVSDRSVVRKTSGGWSHRSSARSPLVTVTPARNCSKGEYGEWRPVGGGWERGRAGWKAAVSADPAMGTRKPRPSWAARPGFTPVRGRRETRIPEATARRVRRPGLRRDSPAGEEMKQRVLLLLIARRHGRAGSAARRSRSWDARGSRAPLASLPWSGSRRRSHARGRPRCPAPFPASRPASQRPLRRFSAASQSQARRGHVAEAGP